MGILEHFRFRYNGPMEPATGAPTVHEAERGSGPSGAVFWGAEIDVATAVPRRQSGLDVVVRGHDHTANQRLAKEIEAAVGPWMRGSPHLLSAGPLALPHYQQVQPPPEGHTFYETANRKARKMP
jgi:hypothetical protein